MASYLDKPNLEFINEVLRRRDMTSRQLSKIIYGTDTHRDIVKEITTKPDVRASTVLKLCRALGITMDSLFLQEEYDGEKQPAVSGTANVVNSSNVKIELDGLRSEVRVLKGIIEDKNKRIKELQEDRAQLGRRLDTILEIFKNQKFGRD